MTEDRNRTHADWSGRTQIGPHPTASVPDAPSVDLPAFLLARIAEDEGVARAAGGGTTEPLSRWWVPARWPESTFADHTTRWNPGRVLVECEARRRIVGRFAVSANLRGPDRDVLADQEAEHVMRLLAAPYADHPDFEPAWSMPA